MDPTPAERDDVIRRLHLAAADGRLTLDEATQRIAAARTADADVLRRLTDDLPQVNLPVAPAPTAPAPYVNPQASFEPYPSAVQHASVRGVVPPGYSPHDPLVLSSGWEGVKRTGEWVVPPFIRASSGLDGVKIDCLQAQAAADVIDLELVAGAGSVTLIVPQGWGVQMDRLGRGFGSGKSKVPTTPAPGYPLVVVHGGVGIGSFKARHANRFDRWRLRRKGYELPPAPARDLR